MLALLVSVGVLIALSHAPGLLRLVLARLGGMRVERVVIGVGPILRRERWVLGAVPVGTYVVIAGRDASGRPTSPALFSGRPWPWKLLVLLAGPIAFYLIAAATMSVTYVAFGEPTDGKRAMIGDLKEGKPAARAGLQVGDEIYAIDNRRILDTSEVAPAISLGGDTVTIEVIRNGEHRTLTVAPEVSGGDRRIGIEIWPVEEFVRGEVGPAVWHGFQFPGRYMHYIGNSFAEIFRGRQKAEFSGPAGIVKVTQKQVSQGLRNTLSITAILSTYLAFWFLWPLPLCDGGRALGYLVRRKPSSEPRDLGDLEPPRGRMPAAVIVTLVLIAAALVLQTMADLGSVADLQPARSQPSPTGLVLLLVVTVGIVRRNPAAWSWAVTVPILAAFASLMAHDGLGALATLAVSALMWRRSARKWFGLHCPACDGGDARPVLAEKHHFGCLRCGSSWISRS